MTTKWLAPFDPAETKNYSVNWGDVLAAFDDDTIVNAPAPGVLFTINQLDTGLTVVSSSVDATQKKAIVWLTADDQTKLRALAGTSITLDHTITTEGGRILNETMVLKIRDK